MADAGNPAAPQPKPPNQPPPLPQQLIQNEAKARFDAAATAEIGFVERLVWFWSNHFCISADKIVELAGPYEREAIRPHVLGRFADLLLAVESHPGMLFYLDNVQSMGANSVAGINRDKGLNENLARETLELHTLGVRSGYSQDDVTSFAKVLTGWSWINPEEPEHGGEFIFMKRLHEPGRTNRARQALSRYRHRPGPRRACRSRAPSGDRAAHCAKARALISSPTTPPPTLVAKLAKTFTDSDGDLKAVATTLVTADEAWTPQRQKLKPPAEWVAGVIRLTGTQADAADRPHHECASGRSASRCGGRRRRTAMRTTKRPGSTACRTASISPTNLPAAPQAPIRWRSSTAASGRSPRPTRAQTIARAESRHQALALLVMTPEFLRR